MAYYKRKTTRIPNYDYSSSNYYFITVCTQKRRCIFGLPNDLNQLGNIVREQIIQISSHYQGIYVDKYVVMPNHIHMILVLKSEKDRSNVNQIIGQFKSGVSREIHKICPDVEVWQRSFHDHIIRSQSSYEKIWLYIEGNPVNWELDCFYIDPLIGSSQV